MLAVLVWEIRESLGGGQLDNGFQRCVRKYFKLFENLWQNDNIQEQVNVKREYSK